MAPLFGIVALAAVLWSPNAKVPPLNPILLKLLMNACSAVLFPSKYTYVGMLVLLIVAWLAVLLSTNAISAARTTLVSVALAAVLLFLKITCERELLVTVAFAAVLES